MMKIVIAGCGIVGTALAGRLSHEKHNVSIIDVSEKNLDLVQSTHDVLGIAGDATDPQILMEAAVKNCDLFIAVTDSDKENMIACVLANKFGAKNTIARVRENANAKAAAILKEEMGLSMLINPEQDAAREIFNSLKYKTVGQVEPLAKGSMEIITCPINSDAPICGMAVKDIYKEVGVRILICGVKRADEVFLPKADTVIQAGDILSFAASTGNTLRFLRKIKHDTDKIKNITIVGGSKLSVALAQMVIDTGINVKIIDDDEEKCKEILSLVPAVDVICGDATDTDLLQEEDVLDCQAVVVATEDDATNTMISMYVSRNAPNCKVIMKIKKSDFEDLLYSLNIASIYNPKYITVEKIIRYVKAIEDSSLKDEVQSSCRVIDNKVSVLEFRIRQDMPHLNQSLKDAGIREDVVIASIYRDGQAFIPGADDFCIPGDIVIAATTLENINRFADIFKK